MIATGDSLRTAREAAELTQQEVAERVGVSARTVYNWERSGSIPRKWWAKLGEVLPAAIIRLADNGAMLNVGNRPEALAAVAAKLSDTRDKVRRYAEMGMTEEEIVEHHLQLVEYIEQGLDGVVLAYEIGVGPLVLRDLLNNLVMVLLDAGTGALVTARDDVDPVRHCLYRIFSLLVVMEQDIARGTTGYDPNAKPGQARP